MQPAKPFPLVISHRGCGVGQLENTVAAFKAVLEIPVDMIEMDVHETQDGRFIVHHDPCLGPDTPPWHHLTYAQIQDLTARNHQAPLLTDCLAAIGSVPVDLEIKTALDPAGLLKALTVTAPAAGSVISSFNHHLLKALHFLGARLPLVLVTALSGRQPLGQYLRTAWLSLWPQRLPAWLHGLAIEDALARPAMIQKLKHRGAKVYVWTVDQPALMSRLIAMGVDGIITNNPRQLAALRVRH